MPLVTPSLKVVTRSRLVWPSRVNSSYVTEYPGATFESVLVKIRISFVSAAAADTQHKRQPIIVFINPKLSSSSNASLPRPSKCQKHKSLPADSTVETDNDSDCL